MTTKARTSGWDPFIRLIRQWLEDLGVNSELFHEIAGDESLPLHVRTLATAVLAYLSWFHDIIPDRYWYIGLIDDVLVMIVALVLIVALMPEESHNNYRRKYEAVVRIAEYEQIVKETLGVLWERLIRFVEGLRNRHYKGKTMEQVTLLPALREELFDQTMIRIANMGHDPATLDKGEKELPSPEKVIGLLSSGLARKQQDEDEESSGQTKFASKRKRLPGTGKSKHDPVPSA